MSAINKKIRQGVVVSDKMEKTITVLVETTKKHPLYKRTMKRTKKYLAHDEAGTCKVGDTVRITECRPLSARKRWRLLNVVQPGRSI